MEELGASRPSRQGGNDALSAPGIRAREATQAHLQALFGEPKAKRPTPLPLPTPSREPQHDRVSLGGQVSGSSKNGLFQIVRDPAPAFSLECGM